MLKIISIALLFSLSLFSQEDLPNNENQDTTYDAQYREGYEEGYKNLDDGIVEGYYDFDENTAEEKAKVIVRRFTAIWCGPCRTYAPIYKKVEDKFKNNNDVFVTSHYNDNRGDQEDFAQITKYEVRSIPTTIIIIPSQNNKIYFKRSGIISQKTLNKKIKRALKSIEKKRMTKEK
ncbi:thioredoxin domain-containing protein [Bacteriovoracaceae bacterium]|nr:thioredoxin domain-containing protein [Bacteriovoracaceae bacterium]